MGCPLWAFMLHSFRLILKRTFMAKTNTKAAAAKAESGERKKLKNLRLWNLSMALLHAVQGLIVIWLGNNYSLPLQTNLAEANPLTKSLEPVMHHVADMRIAPLVALFFFLSAIAHLFLAGPFHEWYERNLKKGINYLRWFEYMFSSSIMIWIIAMLSGIYDLALLLSLFALNAVMNLMGLMMEVHNQSTPKTNWLAFIIGSVAGFIPWLIIGWFFFHAIGTSSVAVPKFVYGIIFTLFIFFWTFPINMILQYKKVGRWKDYLYGEKGYMILSLVAKSLLAWQVFAGTLRAG